MLQLQLKNLQAIISKRTVFLLQLLCFSLCIHAIVLVFIIMQGSIRQPIFIDTTDNRSSNVYLVALAQTTSCTSEHTLQANIHTLDNSARTTITTQSSPIAPTISSKPSVIKKKNVVTDALHTKSNFTQSKTPKQQTVPFAHENKKILHNTINKKYSDVVENIQQGIARHWQRPKGFDESLYCICNVSWDKYGIKRITMQKSSGALAYDTQVYQALMLYDFSLLAKRRSITLKM